MQPAKSVSEYVAQLFEISIMQIGIRINFLDSFCDNLEASLRLFLPKCAFQSNDFL
jgi:hypothetical protein